MQTINRVPPQFQAILDYRNDIVKKYGRDVSMSEAIANWIALGHAEKYRTQHLSYINR